jgi:hypothetical protein
MLSEWWRFCSKDGSIVFMDTFHAAGCIKLGEKLELTEVTV